MARTLDYSVLDVFAEQPLAGNQLAVFHDASSLTTAEMQSLARETNFAETTFILPADPAQEAEHGVRVRIFTTEEEFPFAGHPTLGTATWLHLNHPTLRGAQIITLKLNVGPIPVTFQPSQPGDIGVVGTMRQNDPVFGAAHARSAIAPLLGLAEEDLSPTHAPQTVSTGLPFCIVPLRSVEALQRLQVSQREAQSWLGNSGAKFFYCVAPTNDAAPHAAQWRARMQFYNGEDPATGSATGCCISWLVQHGLATSGTDVVIEQGIEIHRPSRLIARASLASAKVSDVFVSGRTIPVATGRFFLP
ncbi:PhzF family phenazine biosynthesis isomerase [Granulicella sp. 5B5]|uniref:PhzF family phenazine biosynthesis protein n=1 Tax=Granulicella sp. 5B5 TaxID=1617967 RepID=UPI0015F4EE4A|nr:PhzF family phenazine biosynthesis protein [Granulicella sp. 5B5]QMV19447.1 PhzF family phenazine biosynthesis isomerase [Granulicella sp. 5B5]